MTTTKPAQAVILLVALATTACGHVAPRAANDVSLVPTTVSDSRAVIAESHLSAKEADSVALYSVRAVEASDTTIDTSPTDTYWRAAAWLTSSFLATIRHDRAPATLGAAWSTWFRHRAYLAVRASLAADDHPSDTVEAAHRQVYATITPIGRDGWRDIPHTEVLFVILIPVRGSWRLTAVQPG